MSIRKIGFSAAIITLTLLSGISDASARHRWGPHNGHGHHEHEQHGRYKQCFHRHDGVRCFWRWR